VLLQEAIIFRVARILEEFHGISAIKRVYLSGGLSESACLQQGIAQCVSFDVYRLKQRESSLLGAAILASGIKHHRDAKKISPERANTLLAEKYRRWKVWLDELLGV
jgi:glycerol kinase